MSWKQCHFLCVTSDLPPACPVPPGRVPPPPPLLPTFPTLALVPAGAAGDCREGPGV